MPLLPLLFADFHSPELSSRVKKRALLSILNDENADPKTAPNGRNCSLSDDGFQSGVLEDKLSSPSQRAKFAVGFANRVSGKGRVALSTTELNGGFKSSNVAQSKVGAQDC